MVDTSRVTKKRLEISEHVREIRARQQQIWPEHIPREIPEDLDNRTFIDVFVQNARQYPDRTAIEFYGRSISYKELNQWSNSIAHWLKQNGVNKGDRVGLFLPNCPQYVALLLGTMKTGAIYVPINPMFKQGELEYEANDAEISVLIAADYLGDVVKGANIGSLIRTVHIHVPSIVPEGSDRSLPSMLLSHKEQLAECNWSDLIGSSAVVSTEAEPGDTAALNYTGGTTGLPKGCIHTHRNKLIAAHNCALAWGLIGKESAAHETVLIFTPIFWISGENNGVLAPLFAASTIVLLTRWDAEVAVKAIEDFSVTGMSGVVESYLELLAVADEPNRQLRSLRHLRAMSFTKKLSLDIRKQWAEATGGRSVLRESGYGMTETHTSNTFTSGLQSNDFDLRSEPVFVGLPMPGTDFLIIDTKSREPVNIGEPGEIALRSPSNFSGYWRDEAETQATFSNGWVFTGDIGKLSQHGALHYLGRTKEMLKINGMSVFPSEVEILLSDHPDVSAVAVIGKDDPVTGQAIHAFVEKDIGSNVDASTLTEWAKQHMAAYKVPIVHIVNDMPRTPSGKIRKNLLSDFERSGRKRK